jgi:4-hydroxy-tetrahydrodipicolinate synthase
MDREELKKLIVGPIATVPTPFDDDFEVDYRKMGDLTQWWVEQGLVTGRAVIKVAAAMGEGPQLRDEEWPALLRTAVQAADGKASIWCGLHYKDTIRTIEDAKKAQDLGAVGLQISPPVLNGPTQDDIVRHYSDISDAIDIGILVYITRGMPGGSIYPETFERMVDFEHVVAIKWGVPFENKYEDIFHLADRFNIIDNNGTPTLNHKLGGKGYINHTSESYPAHDLKLWDLMEAGRYDEADALYHSVEDDIGVFAGKVGKRTGGQAVVKKGMLAVMGWPVGASRPPSLPLTHDELAELYDTMAGWGWPVAPRAEVLG